MLQDLLTFGYLWLPLVTIPYLSLPYWALLGITGSYLLGLTGPYWALLGFTEITKKCLIYKP